MHMMNSRAQIWVPVIPENCCFVVLKRKTKLALLSGDVISVGRLRRGGF